jgi:hypothetical protein
MRDLVCGEHDGRVLQEPLREEVAERVVFFVEGEDGCVGDACSCRTDGVSFRRVLI